MIAGFRKLTAVCLVQTLLLMGLPVEPSQASDASQSYLQQQTWGRHSKGFLRLMRLMRWAGPAHQAHLAGSPLPAMPGIEVSATANTTFLIRDRHTKTVYRVNKVAADGLSVGDGVFLHEMSQSEWMHRPVRFGDGIVNFKLPDTSSLGFNSILGRFENDLRLIDKAFGQPDLDYQVDRKVLSKRLKEVFRPYWTENMIDQMATFIAGSVPNDPSDFSDVLDVLKENVRFYERDPNNPHFANMSTFGLMWISRMIGRNSSPVQAQEAINVLQSYSHLTIGVRKAIQQVREGQADQRPLLPGVSEQVQMPVEEAEEPDRLSRRELLRAESLASDEAHRIRSRLIKALQLKALSTYPLDMNGHRFTVQEDRKQRYTSIGWLFFISRKLWSDEHQVIKEIMKDYPNNLIVLPLELNYDPHRKTLLSPFVIPMIGLLMTLDFSGETILDLGTGHTGILALVALRASGASRVLGIDKIGSSFPNARTVLGEHGYVLGDPYSDSLDYDFIGMNGDITLGPERFARKYFYARHHFSAVTRITSHIGPDYRDVQAAAIEKWTQLPHVAHWAEAGHSGWRWPVSTTLGHFKRLKPPWMTSTERWLYKRRESFSIVLADRPMPLSGDGFFDSDKITEALVADEGFTRIETTPTSSTLTLAYRQGDHDLFYFDSQGDVEWIELLNSGEGNQTGWNEEQGRYQVLYKDWHAQGEPGYVVDLNRAQKALHRLAPDLDMDLFMESRLDRDGVLPRYGSSIKVLTRRILRNSARLERFINTFQGRQQEILRKLLKGSA